MFDQSLIYTFLDDYLEERKETLEKVTKLVEKNIAI